MFSIVALGPSIYYIGTWTLWVHVGESAAPGSGAAENLPDGITVRTAFLPLPVAHPPQAHQTIGH